MWIAGAVLVVLLLQLSGCTRTEEKIDNLEKRGIEFKSGKVMRVFKF